MRETIFASDNVLIGWLFLLGWIHSMLAMWGAINAAIQPDVGWLRSDQSKAGWIVISIFVPIIGPIVYLLAIRPKVKAAAQGPPRPPPPPPEAFPT